MPHHSIIKKQCKKKFLQSEHVNVIVSPKPGKKFRAIFSDNTHVDFGGYKKGNVEPYEDYTIHHDDVRKHRYVVRHQEKESWCANGYKTAGFWSKHLLWNKPSKIASVKDIKHLFNIQVHLHIRK